MDRITFREPPSQYSLTPFWFWNDDLRAENLLRQMELMLEQHVSEFIIHARKGLTVAYLSEEWFAKIGLVLEHARRLKMKVWIYDEDNFPSGYAGGRVLGDNPDFCGKHLRMERYDAATLLGSRDGAAPARAFPAGKLVCALTPQGDGFGDVTATLQNGTLSGDTGAATEVYLFFQDYTYWNPAYTEDHYIDVLNGEATQAFLKYTQMEYKKRFGTYFGNVIKGFFSDEAGFYNNLTMFANCRDGNTVPWTDAFPAFFAERRGYSILASLPFLWLDHGPRSAEVRADFYGTLCEMYQQNFLEPQKRFCETNGMKFIGHLHMEDYLHLQIVTQGDLTRALNSLSFAGTDRIDRNAEKINEKLISSCAHAYGKERVMSETYALSGWGLTLAEMKKWADWQYVRGINMLVPHAFYASIAGERQWECPPSQFYQNHYWPYYRQFADYVRRLSYCLSQGSHLAALAVYYPMSTAYQLIRPDRWGEVIALDRFIQDLSFALLERQYDFDYLNDEAFLSCAVKDGNLSLRDEQFRILLVPGTLNLPFDILKKLAEAAQTGLGIIFLKSLPEKCLELEHQPEYASVLKDLLSRENVHYLEPRELLKAYTYRFDPLKLEQIFPKYLTPDFSLEQEDRNIKYLHRRCEGQELYFIINEDDCPRSHTGCFHTAKIPELWDPETGLAEAVPHYRNGDGYTCIPFQIAAHGSKLYVFANEASSAVSPPAASEAMTDEVASDEGALEITLPLAGRWDVEIDGHKLQTPLDSWERFGLPYFSGAAIYEKEFRVPGDLLSCDWILQLGTVADCAEVWLNGSYLGFRIWEPYHFKGAPVPAALFQSGTNRLRVKVTNTLRNEFEKTVQLSGLIGPVRLVFSKSRV